MRGLTVSHLIPLFMATFLFSLNCVSCHVKISVSAECICNSPFSSFSSCLYIKPCESFRSILLLLLCRAFHQHGMNKEINLETIGRKEQTSSKWALSNLEGWTVVCGATLLTKPQTSKSYKEAESGLFPSEFYTFLIPWVNYST